MSVADTVHVGHNPALIPPDTEPMLSISQFTEKFLEQNLSKFLYHTEVIVRCCRGSVLSLLFTHFIVFTSFPPWSSPLTLFLFSSFRFHSLEQFSYDLEMKAHKQNRNNKRTEIERFDWFIERTDKRAWLFIG